MKRDFTEPAQLQLQMPIGKTSNRIDCRLLICSLRSFFLCGLTASWIMVAGGCHWYQQWVPRPAFQLTTDDIAVKSLKPGYSSQLQNQKVGVNADVASISNGFDPSVTPDDAERLLPLQQPRLDSDDELPPPNASNDRILNANQNPKLAVEDVLDSVMTSFPQIQAAILQANVAGGNLTAAMGFYDVFVTADTINQPVSFYENYRHGLTVSQNVMENGSRVYAGYRVGRGDFEPWYKERETNEGGEFAVGSRVPLLRNRLIDQQRARVFKAQQDLSAAQPFLQQEQNVVAQVAKLAYWNWVGAGQELITQQRLLKLAQDRADVIRQQVEAGDLARLVLVDNQRLIAQREAVFVQAVRKFEAASIRLSFFLRDTQGNMLVPDRDFVPDFPEFTKIDFSALELDIAQALTNHPQLREFDFELEKQRIEIAESNNDLLGQLDGFFEAAQDVGGPASPLRDKSPFEFRVGLSAEVPVQRRLGIGRVTANQAKLQQMELKRELISNQLKNAIQDTYSAMERAIDRFQAASQNVQLANEALEIARDLFEQGDVDLIVLNIYEQSLADAELLEIQAEVEFFFADANYRLALGER